MLAFSACVVVVLVQGLPVGRGDALLWGLSQADLRHLHSGWHLVRAPELPLDDGSSERGFGWLWGGDQQPHGHPVVLVESQSDRVHEHALKLARCY